MNDGCNVNEDWDASELETTIEVDMLSGDGREVSEEGVWVFVASFLIAIFKAKQRGVKFGRRKTFTLAQTAELQQRREKGYSSRP